MPRPRHTTDDALLGAAMACFWRHGFASTGIRELEAAVGLRAPAIYHRFGSKEGLFAAVLDHYREQVVTARIRHLLQSEVARHAPLVALRRFFDTTFDYIDAQSPPLACLLVNTALEDVGAHPLIATRVNEGARQVRNAFHACLELAQRSGLLAPGADTSMLADALHLGLQGVLVTSRIERDPVQLSRHVDALFSLLPLTEKE